MSEPFARFFVYSGQTAKPVDMRKRIFPLLILLCAATAGYGQEQDSTQANFQSIGVSLGVIPHVSTILNDQFDYQWDLNNIIAGGITLPFGKKSNFALTGDIQLLHTGATTTIGPDPLEAEVIDDVDVRDRFAYLQMAAGLRYYFSNRFYVGGYTGPAIHLYTERLTTKNYVSGFEQEERDKFDFGDGDARDLQWFANVGIGYEIPIGDYIGIVVEPNAYLSIANLDNGSDFDGRAVGIGLRTAILFKEFKRNIKFSQIPEKRTSSYIRKQRKQEKEAKEKSGSGNGSR